MTDLALAASELPVLAIDVDGVLNAPRPRWNSRVERQHVRTSVGEYKVAWSPALIDWLRDLPSLVPVDIWWLTSWGPEVGKLETLWKLPPLGRGIETLLPTAAAAAAKHAFMTEVDATGRPWVWCDDEEAEPIGGNLAIRPDPRCGLTPAHADQIETFLRDRQR